MEESALFNDFKWLYFPIKYFRTYTDASPDIMKAKYTQN